MVLVKFSMTKKKITNYKYKSNTSSTFKTAVIMIICILLLLGIFYLITTKILDNAKKKKDETLDVYIQYDEILAGESFNQKEEEYLVVYYDSSDKYSILKSLVSSYQSKDDVTRVYTVDLANGMNKKYIGDQVDTSSPSSLKVVYPTMLRFKNGSVSETITSDDEIYEYFREK